MELRFAIIGCGRIAVRHAEQMKKHGSIVAVCDIVPEKAISLSDTYGGLPYESHEEMLRAEKEFDIVSICTPNGLHALHSIASLSAGSNVLCEKPLCISTADGRKMIDAANTADRKLFVVKQNRYNPPIEAVKRLMKEKALGKILSFQLTCFWNRPPAYYHNSWKGSESLDGGTLFTQFSHFIDIIYWLLGDAKNITAVKKNFLHPEIEIEDSGIVLFEMMSGAIGTMNYSVNSFGKNMEGSLTLLGEAGTVKIGGQYLNELEYQNVNGMSPVTLPKGNASNDYGYYTGSMSNHDKVYENLVKALKDPNHDFASAADGLKTVEIIERIYKSAKHKQ